MNTFGDSSQQFPLYSPMTARTSRVRFRRDTNPQAAMANSIYIPTGRYPVRGWILLARSDYDQLDKYSTSLILNVGDTTNPNNTDSLYNIAIVQSQCVTTGLLGDDNALYLVEITDARGILYNEWFQLPLVAQYNIRAPAYPDTFYTESLDSGTPWTWETMLEDIWDTMSTLLGDWPGFPAGYSVTGTPEGFWFTGVSTWAALCDVLDYIGLTIVCDLTNADSPYSIVEPGAADNAFDDLTDTYATNIEDDLDWIDVGSARVPATVVVLFRYRNQTYGVEETVRSDAYQWSTHAVYQVPVDAPDFFTGAVGTHYLWSDFTVRLDQDADLNTDDVTLANTIANERVEQYFAKIYRQTLGYMSRTYAGALPFTTGSQVDGVCYSMDYSQLAVSQRHGWRTKLVRGPCPPFSL